MARVEQPNLSLDGPNYRGMFANWGGPSRGFTVQTMAPGSEGSSYSRSGERYTPQQQRLLDSLYPMLLQGLKQNQQPAGGGSFAQMLSQVGGSPVSIGNTGVGAPFDFGKPADYTQGAASFGQAEARPEITIGGVYDEQRQKEMLNMQRALGGQQTTTRMNDLAAKVSAGGGVTSSLPFLAQQSLLGAIGQFGIDQELGAMQRGFAEQNARHRLDTERAGVERAENLSRENFERQQAGAGDLFSRLQLESAENSQNKQLASRDSFLREQLRSQNELDSARLRSEDDIRRRQLTVQNQQQNADRAGRDTGSYLQALLTATRPLSYSQSQSQQSSGLRGGGQLKSRRASNPWDSSMWS